MNAKFLFGEKGKITVFEKGLEQGLTKEPSLRWLFIVLIISILIVKEYEKDYIKSFILLVSVFLIFTTEIINTSIEAVVDRIGKKYNILSGYAKDLGSSATIIWVLFSLVIWSKWFINQWKLYENDKESIFNSKLKLVYIVFNWLTLLSYNTILIKIL